MKTNALTVSAAQQDQPLIELLANHLNCSLRKAKGLLDRRVVFVNGQRVWMARHSVKKGDVIELVEETSATPTTTVEIRYRNKDFVVVNKRPGMLSNGSGSAEEVLRQQLALPGLRAVHRLDRDTSGCLCFAKSEEAFERAVHWFKAGRINKFYDALVFGQVERYRLTIQKKIEGQTAVSHVERLAANERASHVRVKIDTGRTHQIRKHLSSIRHPVLGDREYFTKRLDDPRLRRVPRQMLHAAVFHAPLGQNEKMVWVESPLPPDFRSALKQFGLFKKKT
jgi:23S rRNA pseudouridine1911/1915/1917 synthase